MPERPSDDPVLILMGGTDELRLEEGGKVYRPGDRLPSSLSHAWVVALAAAGIRIENRHTEPKPTQRTGPAKESK